MNYSHLIHTILLETQFSFFYPEKNVFIQQLLFNRDVVPLHICNSKCMKTISKSKVTFFSFFFVSIFFYKKTKCKIETSSY
jgi:hypothetical protein